MKRVVVTAMGALSPFGTGVDALMDGFLHGASAIRRAPETLEIGGMRSAVKAVVPEVDERSIPRKYRRSMSRLGIFAALAAREAWQTSGLYQAEVPETSTGVCIGSTMASPDALESLYRDYLVKKSLNNIKSTKFFQIMGHCATASVAQMLGLRGRSVAPSAACATGCQAVGLAADFVRYGLQERMLAGGADEFHPMTTGIFDIINAASTAYNDRPEMTPRPFDAERDGLVCGEGAGVLVVEELEAAKARGARIMAEIASFATVSDPSNLANPDSAAIERCMREALDSAGLSPGEVDYVNAHATGTIQGDEAESQAIARVFGDQTPVSSLKGHIGHTIAAAGALELIAVVEMIARDAIIATRNLSNVAPDCEGVDHVAQNRDVPVTVALKNSFAMGGVNASIVLRRFEDD